MHQKWAKMGVKYIQIGVKCIKSIRKMYQNDDKMDKDKRVKNIKIDIQKLGFKIYQYGIVN